MDEPNDQTSELDPIAIPSASGLRVQAGVFSVVSVLVVVGLSANCIFFRQGVQWWHVLLVLVPIVILHFWFAWRIGRRTIRLLDEHCIVSCRFGPFRLSQTFLKDALSEIRLAHRTDHESSDRWTVQLRSQRHAPTIVYFATSLNQFGRYPEWQPIVIMYDVNAASTLCSRIAAWANIPFSQPHAA